MRAITLIMLMVISTISAAQTTLMSLITWNDPTHYENGEALDPSSIAGYSVHYEVIGNGQTIQDVASIEGNQIEALIHTSNVMYGLDYKVRARVMSHTITGSKSEWSEWSETTITANGIISIMAPPGILISCEPSCLVTEK